MVIFYINHLYNISINIKILYFIIFSFSKIKEDYIKEFYKKISDLANLEADRRSQILAQQQATGNSGGTNELLQDDWNEDQLNVKTISFYFDKEFSIILIKVT